MGILLLLPSLENLRAPPGHIRTLTLTSEVAQLWLWLSPQADPPVPLALWTPCLTSRDGVL